MAMETGDWQTSVLDELAEGGVEICVFPTSDDEGTFMTAEALKSALGPVG